MARAVDGVEEALRLGPTLVFNASREGREDVGVGECARDEAIDGRGEENVDMVAVAERMKRDARGQINGVKRWSVPCGWKLRAASFFALVPLYQDLLQ